MPCAVSKEGRNPNLRISPPSLRRAMWKLQQQNSQALQEDLKSPRQSLHLA